MTRYEFTVAIARYISPSGKSNVLEHQLFITTLQADALQRLIQKFEPELQALGIPHLKVERRMVWNTLRVPSTWQTEIFIRPQVIAPAFKDISKNHWAFAVVETLRKNGIVIGYPSLSSSGAREIFQ